MNAATLVSQIIHDALKLNSSDIHFEPTEKDIRLRFRIDGILYEKESISREYLSQIISRIKIMANLDIAEHRLPQDGSAAILSSNISVDMRISTMPTINGEKIVIRLLDPRKTMIGLENLGMRKSDLNIYKDLLSKPYGMILVTGPTGSGKTTTLYSSLLTLDRFKKNIVTIEDPVEYKLNDIVQTQINYKTGLTFARGLRSILRQDPDIIMVGEIRDTETARIAVSAAMTGHLMLATMHTNDSCSAICRLIDMGIEPYFINSVLLGVVAQRLVRKKCGTGYAGRTGIYEVLVVNDNIKEVVSRKHTYCEIKFAAEKEGLSFMSADGFEKAGKGITTYEEVHRIVFFD